MRYVLPILAALTLAGCGGGHDSDPHAGSSHAGLLATLEQAGTAEGTPALQAEPRSVQMTRFPCARCHDKPMAVLKQTRPAAHWEVKLEHAAGLITECKTCHTENTAASLHLLNGKEVSFDASYELCAQCHSRQVSDWRGGAHGKRTTGWGEERRVLSCTGCHNPHRPSLAPRWPASKGGAKEVAP